MTTENQEDPGSVLLNALKLEKVELSKQLTTLQGELAKFKGVDPDEFILYKTEYEKNKNSKTKTTMDESQLKQQIEEQVKQTWGGKLTEAEDRAKRLEAQVKEMTVTDKVFSLFGDSVVPETSSFVKELIRKSCDLEGNEIIIKDESGKPIEEKPGVKLSADKWKGSIVEKFPNLFKSTVKSGLGTQQNKQQVSVNAGDITPEQAKRMSKEEFNKLSPADRAKVGAAFLNA